MYGSKEDDAVKEKLGGGGGVTVKLTYFRRNTKILSNPTFPV